MDIGASSTGIQRRESELTCVCIDLILPADPTTLAPLWVLNVPDT